MHDGIHQVPALRTFRDGVISKLRSTVSKEYNEVEALSLEGASDFLLIRLADQTQQSLRKVMILISVFAKITQGLTLTAGGINLQTKITFI